MICPSFWTLPAGLTRANCPKVVDNKAAPNDEALIRSMYGSIVHMLVNVYLPESLDYGNSVVEEVNNVQDAVALNATESMVNANNYALYAGGEHGLLPFHYCYTDISSWTNWHVQYLTLVLAIQAGCTDWPIVPQCEAEGTCAWPSS